MPQWSSSMLCLTVGATCRKRLNTCYERSNQRAGRKAERLCSSTPQKRSRPDRSTGERTMLVLALVLRPGEVDGNVEHAIPRVVDADEQEQHRHCADDEQSRHRMAWEHTRRDEECGVGDQRQDCIPQPVFQHRLILRLTACPPEHDDDVDHPPETAEAEQQDRKSTRLNSS